MKLRKDLPTSHNRPGMPMYKGIEGWEVFRKDLPNTSHRGPTGESDYCKMYGVRSDL